MKKQSSLTIRLDEELKDEFAALCKNFGMSVTTAFTVYARAVVRNRRIPFEIADDTTETEPTTSTRSNKKGNAQIQDLTSKLLGAIGRGSNNTSANGKKESNKKSARRTK